MSKKKGKVSLASPVAAAPPPPAIDAAPADPHTALIQSLLHEGAALNKDAIRRACREDGVPRDMRGAVWQVLLDVWGRDDDTLFDANVALDLKDQAVIQVDLERTRTDEPTFAHKAARDEAAALLTLYCKRRSVPYSQGLNEIVAPFFFIGVARDVKFQLFYATVQRFFPLLFRGDDMRRHLDPLMHCLRLLLQYHDPQLVALADQYNVNTELWALPWLFTIFASAVPIAIVLHIWDLLLLSSDNAAPLYFACAVIINQRSSVLECDPDALPLVMRNSLQRACGSCSAVNDVWVLAENLMLSTPQSFKTILHKALTSTSLTHHEFASCDGQLCLSLEAREVAGVWGTVQHALKYFVLDCRSRAEFSRGRLPTAMLVDVDAFRADPESMQPILDIVLELRDQHIAIMGRGHDDADAASVVTMLLAKGMPHVGLINGGYAEVLRLAELRLVELADFVAPAEIETEDGSKSYMASPLRQVTSALGDVTSNVSSKLGSVSSKLEAIGFAAADKAQVRGKAALDAVAADTQQLADKAHVKAKAALGAVAADTQQLKAVAQSKAASALGFLGAAIGSIKQQFLEEPAPAPAPKPSASKDTLIDLGEWLRRDHTTFLTCQYLLPDGSFQPRNIIVAEDLVLFVQAHPTRLNIGKLMHGYKLTDLKQLSFKTEDPNMVTFHFKKEGMTDFKTHTASVTPTQKAQCVAAVKSNMQRLKARRAERQQRVAAAAAATLDDKTVAAAAAIATASRDMDAAADLSQDVSAAQQPQEEASPTGASPVATPSSPTNDLAMSSASAPEPSPSPQASTAATAASSQASPAAAEPSVAPAPAAADDDFLSFLQSEVGGISLSATAASPTPATPSSAAAVVAADDDDLPDWLQ